MKPRHETHLRIFLQRPDGFPAAGSLRAGGI